MTQDRDRELTGLERAIDRAAHRVLAGRPSTGLRGFLVECAVFLLKQAWACIFGVLLLVAIVAARLWYPDDAALARNDALTIAAILIQIGMLLPWFGTSTHWAGVLSCASISTTGVERVCSARACSSEGLPRHRSGGRASIWDCSATRCGNARRSARFR